MSTLALALWVTVFGVGHRLAGHLQSSATAAEFTTATFFLCKSGMQWNCVVDGDTIRASGVKIRIEDIDAPETHSPRCAHEAERGARTTQRLLELMNAAPVAIIDDGGPDEDRYGRKLRVLMQHGESIGSRLVREGLARPWIGHREPWC